MRLFGLIRMQWDIARSRFRVAYVSTEAERTACNELLARVRGDELGRGGLTYGDVPLYDPDGDNSDLLLACYDGDRLIGAAQATVGTLIAAGVHGSATKVFEHSRFGEMLPKTYECHRTVLERDMRGSGASLVMFRFLYAHSLRGGALFTLLFCEPQLLRLYARLGFRPLSAPYARGGRVLIPLLLHNHDGAHLARCASPLLTTWISEGRLNDPSATAWWKQYVAEYTPPAPGFTQVDENELAEMPLFVGLSEAGVKGLLANANRVELEPGSRVMEEGDMAHWMAVVESGVLLVRKGDRILSMATRGDVVGEMSLILGKGRSADVVAGPAGATVTIMSQSAVKGLKQPADEAQLWKNLASIVAHKLQLTSV